MVRGQTVIRRWRAANRIDPVKPKLSVLTKVRTVLAKSLFKSESVQISIFNQMDDIVELSRAQDAENEEKRISPANAWIFILNFPLYITDDDIASDKYIERIRIDVMDAMERQGVERYIFQLEKGNETGRLHFQGWLQFPEKKKKRWTKLKVCPSHSFKRGRGDTAENVIYCSKGDTHIRGPWYKGIQLPRKLHQIDPKDFYQWQKDVCDIVKEPCEGRDRRIHWYWDVKGEIGKSAVINHLIDTRHAMIVTGKAADIAYSIRTWKEKFGEVPEIVCVNIPRSNKDLALSYGTLEAIKDGAIYSGKYESMMLRCAPIHVLIFANKQPDLTLYSEDRWRVTKLTSESGAHVVPQSSRMETKSRTIWNAGPEVEFYGFEEALPVDENVIKPELDGGVIERLTPAEGLNHGMTRSHAFRDLNGHHNLLKNGGREWTDYYNRTRDIGDYMRRREANGNSVASTEGL